MKSDIIFSYFPNLSEKQKYQIRQLYPLYSEWNDKINVVSRKDIGQLYERHVLHSLAIAKFIPFAPGSKILDLGTGGGFPGIPLAILFPNCHFHLVDAIGKKITVVKDVIEVLRLNNLIADHQRGEKLKGTFDFIVSRAVTEIKQFFIWTHRKISAIQKNDIDNGLILLKGGDLREEMKEFKRPYFETNISAFFMDDFFSTKKILYVPIRN